MLIIRFLLKARLYFCVLSHLKNNTFLRVCKLNVCIHYKTHTTVSKIIGLSKITMRFTRDDAAATTPRLTPGVIQNDIKERRESRMQLITWRQQFWKWFRNTRVEIGIGSPLRNYEAAPTPAGSLLFRNTRQSPRRGLHLWQSNPEQFKCLANKTSYRKSNTINQYFVTMKMVLSVTKS